MRGVSHCEVLVDKKSTKYVRPSFADVFVLHPKTKKIR